MERFGSAARLAPEAAEPLFNQVLTLHERYLPVQANEALDAYRAVKPDAVSIAELVARGTVTENHDESILMEALRAEDTDLAWKITKRNPNAFWRVLIDVALVRSRRLPQYSSIYQVAALFEGQFHDRTRLAILAPLLSEKSDEIVAARKEVAEALVQHQIRKPDVALQLLDSASRLVDPDLDFDRLWITIVRAGPLIWTRRVPEARDILDSVVDAARRKNYRWLAARALSIYGVDYTLSEDRLRMISRLREAIETYEAIGAPAETVRARFYLATYLNREGSFNESLSAALGASEHVSPGNHNLLLQLHAIVGSSLTAERNSVQGLPHLTEAARQAELAGDSAIAAQFHVQLAEIKEANSQSRQADDHLMLAQEAVLAADSSEAVEALLEVNLTLPRARILANRGYLDNAESLLTDALPVLDRVGIDVVYRYQYRLLLAGIYRDKGDANRARDEFRLALEAIEFEDDLLAPPARLAFDLKRRETYEEAIAFELDHGDLDRAWEYAQRYRTKLITEMLAQYSPTEEGFADRVSIATRDNPPPEGVTVLEYTMLEDLLLVWAMSSDVLVARQYPITRKSLTAKVERFLKLLEAQSSSGEVQELAQELHRTLIGPVTDLVTEAETISIIPDRILNRLPFDALLLGDGRYLLDAHVSVGTPSVTYFMSPLPDADEPGKVVAIGSRVVDPSIRAELAEVAGIHDGTRIFDQFDVDKKVFLDGVNGAALFQYSGHSAADGTNALMSSIQLDGRRDGPNTVTAMEIAKRELAPNAVVVLASCDSSVGNSTGGAGVRGLTSAFLIAGAGTVVGSLWPVETDSTREIVVRFHRALKIGRSPAQALREARISFLQDFPERSHPYYWAGFTVTGNRSALEPLLLASETATESEALSR